MKTRVSWGLALGLLAVAVLAGTADAQERQRGGRGRFGMFGGTNLMALAGNEAVQKEIGADEAATGKIRSLREEYGTAIREEMSAAGGGRNFQDLSDDERRQLVTKMREASAKVNEKFEPKLKETLTADQFKRLQEIYVRAAGIDALTDSRVAKELAITDEQTKKIADVRAEYGQKQQSLGRDAGFEARRELREEELKKATDVLTKEQQDKLAALKGKEFDLSQLRQGRGDGNRGDGNRRRRPQEEN